jgi:hypothetical protein
MSKESIAHVSLIKLKANEELIKRTKRKSSKGFWMVSKETWKDVSMEEDSKPEWEKQGIDFIDELVSMSKGEQAVIKLVKDSIVYDTEEGYFNYVVTIDKTICEMEGLNYRSFLRSYRLLNSKNFMKRVGKNKYMLNPDFFIPSKEYSLFLHIWWVS